ncbi:MAG: hypothetical protein NC321_16605 [Clostridium sp.]|nr:hypothetical protein [Clostridium sp.]
MSMEITTGLHNYTTNSINNANDANTAKSTGGTKESGVTTNTVELKTSTPGVTKAAQIKTGYTNVNDYSRYLQGKYSYMNTGTGSMQGVPTTISVSSAFLQKCMNDPEKAKYLEENLAAIPDCVKSLVGYTRMMPGSPVCTYAAYYIDDNGNITAISSCTNDPDGKIAKENAKRKAQEEKAAEEKAAKRRAEKKAEEEKALQKRAEKKSDKDKAAKRRAEKKTAEEERLEMGEYSVSVTGTDVKAVTQNLIAVSVGASAPAGAGFDRKA